MTQRVGFIGMGIMGSPMAINLAKAQFSVTVYNRTADKCRAAAAAGATVATTIAELVHNSDVIWLMLAAELKRTVHVTDAAAEVFGAAKAAGDGGNDIAALYKLYAKPKG